MGREAALDSVQELMEEGQLGLLITVPLLRKVDPEGQEVFSVESRLK